MNYGALQTNKPYDNGTFTVAQISYLGQIKEVPHITPYGFYSMPPVDSAWCIFPLRDNDDDMVGFGNDYEGRPDYLKEGEICIYNTQTASKVHLQSNGDIQILAPTQSTAKIWDAKPEYKEGDITKIEDGRSFTALTDNTDKFPLTFPSIWEPFPYSEIVLGADGVLTISTLTSVVVNTKVVDMNIETSMTVDCPETTWTGNITMAGNLTQTGAYSLTGTGTATVDFVSAGKSGATHQHNETGSVTSAPI